MFNLDINRHSVVVGFNINYYGVAEPYLGAFQASVTQKCGVLRNLIPFVQFKKREKHPWRSVTNATKPCNASQTVTGFWPLTFPRKNFITDVSQDSKYTSVLN